ncbi:hypothetical protein BJ912DRAFT_954696 [Pholiota molesta]|nr:hypothetical protein BJ912DRAFT_954696 [Pholiota molesta]
MAFLQRQRSIPALNDVEKKAKDLPQPIQVVTSYAAVENVPQRHGRTLTTSNMGSSHIMRRVSSIFLPRKKPKPLNLNLLDSALTTASTRVSYSSPTAENGPTSDDDIRIPSGLGSAVTFVSNHSLPPSPFLPPDTQDSFRPPQEYMRTRAISSPNLLRTLTFTVRGKAAKTRRESVVIPPTIKEPRELPTPTLFSKFRFILPAELLILVFSYLPRSDILSCSTVSRSYAAAARASLYNCIEFDTLSPLQSEQLIALLVSRSDLTDLVTTFICRKWPPFFLTDAYDQSGPLVSLTLPAFDISLLAHHSAFGLKSLTFLHHTATDACTKAMFAWLDGQTNIISLRFPNLDDTPQIKLDPISDAGLSKTHSSPNLLTLSNGSIPRLLSLNPLFMPSPSPPAPQYPLSDTEPFASPTLLPNLTVLHAPPSLALLLATPLSSGATRRPLTSVFLNINTTLYNGLRPAALMGALRGHTTHLALRFSEIVDRRTFEKMLGAVGASLGPTTPTVVANRDPSDRQWDGLRELDIGFETRGNIHPGRDECASFAATLHALSALRFFVAQNDSADDADDTTDAASTTPTQSEPQQPSAPEQILLDSWAKSCRTLDSVTLFSGARWNRSDQKQSPA